MLSLTQNIFSLPVLLSEKHSIHPNFQVNPKYLRQPVSDTVKRGKPLRVQKLWTVFNNTLAVLIAFGLFRIAVLFSSWKQNPDFEQLGYNGLLVTICGIGKSAYSALKFHINELVYLINQRFRLVKNVPIHHVTSNINLVVKKHPPKETFIYIFSIGAMTFLVALFAGIPLVRPYDPFQMSFSYLLGFIETSKGSLVPCFLVKLVSCLCFLILVSYGVAIFLTQLFVNIISLEAFIQMSRNLIEKVGDLRNPGSRARFYHALRNFNNLRLMIRLCNVVLSDYLFVLLALGIGTASLGGFVMVVMYSEFPLMIYVACSGIFYICQCINFMLVTWAGIPNGNCKRFKQYWRGELKGRREKKMLKACPEVGLDVGFLRNIKYLTALTISDNIINTTATLALMKVHSNH